MVAGSGAARLVWPAWPPPGGAPAPGVCEVGERKGLWPADPAQPSVSLLSFPLPTCLASWRMRYHPLGHPAYPSLPSDTLLLVVPREIEFRAWSLWSRDREVVGGSLPWDSGVGGWGGDVCLLSHSAAVLGIGYRAGAVRSSLTGRAPPGLNLAPLRWQVPIPFPPAQHRQETRPTAPGIPGGLPALPAHLQV